MNPRDDAHVDRTPIPSAEPNAYPKLLAPLTYAWYRGTSAVAGNVFRGPAGRRAVGAIGFASGLALSKKRLMVARHQRRILGPNASEAQVQASVTGAFRSYARYWHEMSRIRNMVRSGELDRNLSLDGFEHFTDSVDAGKGTILVLPHLGGFEAAGAWLAAHGFPLTVVAEVVEPRSVFDWFVRIRDSIGMNVIPLGPSALGKLAGVLRSNGVVCLLADRDLSGDGISVQFFGGTTTMPGGPAVLALRTGARIIPAAAYFEEGQGHNVEVLPPIDTARSGTVRQDVERITQAIADSFEHLIRKAPDQWLVMLPVWEDDE